MSNEINKYKHDVNFSPAIPSGYIDIREVFGVIWQAKWPIIAITAVFAIASVVFSIKQPNVYTSEALLAPASEDQGGGLGALASQFGGLASLAGVNLGGKGGSDKSELALEVLKSRKFTSDFIQRHNILPDLIAVSKWEQENNKVIYNPKIYNEPQQLWLREVDAPYKPEPSMQEAYKAFSKIITVSKDKLTGMVTISVDHVSPYVAHQWVTWLVQDINKVMKERDVAEAHRSTDFLNKQIALTNVADIKAVLYKLIEEQAKTIMFAEVRDEYVFKTIDPAIVPEEKTNPKRAIICILGTLLGGMLAIMLVLFRYFLKK